jgi:hypothetical protein
LWRCFEFHPPQISEKRREKKKGKKKEKERKMIQWLMPSNSNISVVITMLFSKQTSLIKIIYLYKL